MGRSTSPGRSLLVCAATASVVAAGCSTDNPGTATPAQQSAGPAAPSAASVPATTPTATTPATPAATPPATPAATTPPVPAAASPTPAPPKPPPLAQLPRGGRTVFPDHRVVCYYGEGTPYGRGVGKGILGRGKPETVIPELKRQAKVYERYGRKVLPCLELVTTVAHRRAIPAGRDGTYSQRIDPKVVQRHLDVARKHKMLLVLDFQPGRGRFLPQVKAYEKFLREPDVAVALDPEWRTPYSRPFAGTGRVTADEVNEVVRYVAGLTRKHKLPQKLFVVHQFTAEMVRGRSRIEAPKELAVTFHIDGIGGPSLKRAVYRNLAPGKPFHPAFKLFYRLDKPTMTPGQAMSMQPRPEMISYQ